MRINFYKKRANRKNFVSYWTSQGMSLVFETGFNQEMDNRLLS